MTRSPLSLFVLILFSSGANVVNCDDSADYNNDEWKSIFYWITPDIFASTQRQRETQHDSDTSAQYAAHFEEKTVPPHPSNDFELFPFVVFPKITSTAVSSYAISPSSTSDDDDKIDMRSIERISQTQKQPQLNKIIPKEDVVVAKTENTATESVVPSDSKGKESETKDDFFDYDMLSRLLEILGSIDEKKEKEANPDIEVYENFYRYFIGGEDSENAPSCKKSTVKEEIEADSSNNLPDTLNPSKSDTEISSIDFVPIETTTTTVAEAVTESEATSDLVPRKELNIGDEMSPKETPADENKQHDTTDDNKNAKKDYQMPRLTLGELLKRFVLLK